MARDEQRRLFEPLAAAGRPGRRPRPRHRLPDRPPARRRHHGAERGGRRARSSTCGCRSCRSPSRHERRAASRDAGRARRGGCSPPWCSRPSPSALPASRVLFERDIHAYWYPHARRCAPRSPRGRAAVEPLGGLRRAASSPTPARSSPTRRPGCCSPLPLPLQFELVTIGHCLLAAAGAAALARRLGRRLARRRGRRAARTRSRGRCFRPRACTTTSPARRSCRGCSSRSRGCCGAGTARARWSWGLVGGAGPRRLGRPVLMTAARRARPGGASTCAPRAVAEIFGAAAAAGPRGRRSRSRSPPCSGCPRWSAGVHGLRAAQDFRTRTLLVAPPGVARRPRRAAARLRRARSRPRERGRLFESREPLLSCLYLGVVTLALGALGARPAPAAGRPARRGGCVLPAAEPGPPHPALRPPAGAAGVRPAALSAEVPAARVAVPGAPGGARRRGLRACLERRRAPARARPRGVVAPRARARDGRRRGLRLPAEDAGGALATAQARAQRAAAGALVPARSPGAAPPAVAAARRYGGVPAARGDRPRARGSRHEPGRPGRSLRRSARRARPAASAPAVACTPRPRAPRVSHPGEGPPGWEPGAVAALGFLDTLRPPAGIAGACAGSYDGEFTGLGPRFSAAFAEVVHARLGTPGGAAPAPARRRRARAVPGSSRRPRASSASRRSRRPTPARCSCCACPRRCRAPSWWAASVEERGDALAACSAPGFDPRREVLLAGGGAASAVVGAPADGARGLARRRRARGGRGARGPRRAGGDRGLRRGLERRRWTAARRRCCEPTGSSAPCGSAPAGTRCASATVPGRSARARCCRRSGSAGRSGSACALRRGGRD